MNKSRDVGTEKPKKNAQGQKKYRPFRQYMKRKLALTFAFVALALFALAIVLLTISRDKNEEYQKIVYSQQDYDSRTIAFRRGDIVDRNGTVLATTTRLYNLILDPVIIKSDSKYTDTTIDALVECYGYDRQELTQLINEKETIGSRYVVYTKEMSEEDMNRFLDLKAKIAKDNAKKDDPTEAKKRVAGVWFETKYKRIYPYDDLACWLIGFSRDDSSKGSYGVEQYYNSELVGTNGREYGYLNDDSNLQRVIKPAEDGNTIVTTIDATIQRIVQEHIARAQKDLDAYNIGVVVMDPDNGEILAMAGDAAFDLNNPADSSALLGIYTNKYDSSGSAEHVHYTREMIDAMTQEEKTQALNELWRNFCISYSYEPGSTTKSLVVAAALDEADIKTTSGFECNGGEVVGGWTIKCNNGRAHGWQNLKEVLGNSCNDALMYIGSLLGRHEMSRYQKIFGFGQKTGVDLPGEATGILYAEEKMDVATVATNAFGQNMNVTMIQQIAAYCSLVNGGTYYEPHIVRQIKNSDGAVLEEFDGEAVRQTISADTSSYVLDAMLDVVDVHTGKNAQIDGYEVWGKTGTAERQGRNKNDYLLSFIGGVPADDPEIILYVIVDAPQGVEEQARSAHASTLWREIMTDLLPYMNLYPTRELKNPPEETTPAVPEVEVETNEDGEPMTDEDGNPISTTRPPAVYEEEDNFSGGIFGNGDLVEPEGEADPDNER